MQIHVHAMGYLQRRMPGQKTEITTSMKAGATLSDLIAQLGPDPSKVLLIQVNGEQSTVERVLVDGDDVVLYPRISGG